MKTTSLKMLIAIALSISTVSAVNAAPAALKIPSTIAYDQGGNDPFPTSAPEARDEGSATIAHHEGGTDPFPTSAPEVRDSDAKILAHHEGGIARACSTRTLA